VDLVAVQPLVTIDDYLDPEAFVAHHREIARRVVEVTGGSMVDGRPAAPGGRGTRPVLAVWPEYVATFLLLSVHPREAKGCSTVAEVLRRVVIRHLASLLGSMARNRTLSATQAVIAMLAPEAHRLYVETFSSIAKDFGLWVVAGSGLFPRYGPVGDQGAHAGPDARPEPGTRAGSGARAEPGPIYNTSYTFDPTGRVVARTRKVNLVPTQEDVLGIRAGRAEELEAVETPFGRLGTLICYDGFHEPHTSDEPSWTRCAPVLDRLGVTVVAQPSANAWKWDAPWAFNEPGEHLRRSEQWFSEGMPRELAELRSVRYVVNPQLVGSVLDNSFEAPSLILRRDPGGVQVIARSEHKDAEDILHVRVEAAASADELRDPGARAHPPPARGTA
jgi:predicted amidohydrolase